MTPQCTFTLPNGRKCRCAATRHQKFCRHHAPQTAHPPGRNSRPLTRVRRWGGLHRALPSIDPAEIPFEAWSVLEALLRDGPTGISDRVAGRLLRGLLRRFGSVPFPLPPMADEQPSPAPATRQKPPQVAPQSPSQSNPFMALAAKLGPGAADRLSDEEFLQALAEITGTRPSLTSTRSSS